MIQVMNVPGRTHILIHRGNYPRCSWGCLLTNLSCGQGYEEWQVNGIPIAPMLIKKIYPLIADEMDKGEVVIANCQ